MKEKIGIDFWGTLALKNKDYFSDNIYTAYVDLCCDQGKHVLPEENFKKVKKNTKQALNFAMFHTCEGYSSEFCIKVLLEKLGLEYSEDFYNEYQKNAIEFHPRISMYQNTKKHFIKLQQKYDFVLCSNTMFISGESIQTFLDSCFPYFSEYRFSDKMGISKPHPEMFEGLSYMIGDTTCTDIEGAINCGVNALLCNNDIVSNLKTI